jgi:hypothetical protein
MTWLLESPWPAIIGGVLAEIGLAFVFFSTGRAKVALAMAAVAAIAAGFVLLAWLVVTDREQIRLDVFDAASAIEKGNVDGVLRHISPSAKGVQDQARRVTGMHLREVRVADDLKIDVRSDVDPKQAKVDGVVSVGVSGSMKGVWPVRVTLFMRKDGEQWVIYVCEYHLGLK